MPMLPPLDGGGPASISILAITVGKFTSKDRVPSSAAIRLPTSVLATKFRLLAGLGGTTKVADITKRFGAQAAFLEGEKRFFR
jgi:hypothetical protein